MLVHVGDLPDDEVDPAVEAESRARRASEVDVGCIGVDADHRGPWSAGVGQPERRVADPTSQVDHRARIRGPHQHRRKLHHCWSCREQSAAVLTLVPLRLLKNITEAVTSTELHQLLLDVLHGHSLHDGTAQ